MREVPYRQDGRAGVPRVDLEEAAPLPLEAGRGDDRLVRGVPDEVGAKGGVGRAGRRPIKEGTQLGRPPPHPSVQVGEDEEEEEGNAGGEEEGGGGRRAPRGGDRGKGDAPHMCVVDGCVSL